MVSIIKYLDPPKAREHGDLAAKAPGDVLVDLSATGAHFDRSFGGDTSLIDSVAKNPMVCVGASFRRRPTGKAGAFCENAYLVAKGVKPMIFGISSSAS